MGGVVGVKKPRYLIWGVDALIANAMESNSPHGKITVSGASCGGGVVVVWCGVV